MWIFKSRADSPLGSVPTDTSVEELIFLKHQYTMSIHVQSVKLTMDKTEDAYLAVHENEDEAINDSDDDEFDYVDKDDEDSLSPEMDLALKELASRLCAICQSLCRGEVKVLEYWKSNGRQHTGELEHHHSLSSLRESVDAGCPLCKEVAQTFKEHLDMKPEVRDAVTDSWYITCWLDKSEWGFDVDGLCFNFTFYDSHGQSVNPKLGARIPFFPAEKFGLGPEYSG